MGCSHLRILGIQTFFFFSHTNNESRLNSASETFGSVVCADHLWELPGIFPRCSRRVNAAGVNASHASTNGRPTSSVLWR